MGADPHQTRKDLALLRRAKRENWAIPEQAFEVIPQALLNVAFAREPIGPEPLPGQKTSAVPAQAAAPTGGDASDPRAERAEPG